MQKGLGRGVPCKTPNVTVLSPGVVEDEQTTGSGQDCIPLSNIPYCCCPGGT